MRRASGARQHSSMPAARITAMSRARQLRAGPAQRRRRRRIAACWPRRRRPAQPRRPPRRDHRSRITASSGTTASVAAGSGSPTSIRQRWRPQRATGAYELASQPRRLRQQNRRAALSPARAAPWPQHLQPARDCSVAIDCSVCAFTGVTCDSISARTASSGVRREIRWILDWSAILSLSCPRKRAFSRHRLLSI